MLCRICTYKTKKIMSFGKQPLANSFLNKQDFSKELFYEMVIAFCQHCFTVQLEKIPNKRNFFNQDYAFASQGSSSMMDHFQNFSKIIKKQFKKKHSPFIVEIGSNDGIFLKNFTNDKKYTLLGIEPASKISQKAKNEGINILNDFFSYKVSKNIKKQLGKADLIYAANVFSHVSNIKSIIKGIENLLEDDGQFIFEVPYLLDIIKKNSFDQIYNEHVYFFSIISLINLFKNSNLHMTKVDRLKVHGGSIRVCVKKKPPLNNEKAAISKIIKIEKKNKLNNFSAYKNFKFRILDIKEKLIKKINHFHKNNISISGYGATAKSSTILNFCDFGPQQIKFITDNTPTKISKYSPGSHIPIKSNNFFKKNLTDIVILFAWNHKNEILKKEKKLRNVKWLVYNKRIQLI